MVISINERSLTHKLEIHHFVTLITGESGVGKTRLYDVIRRRNDFGTSIISEKNVFTLNELGLDAQSWFAKHKDSIIFIDEDSKELLSDGFFRLAKRSGCNLVIFSRSLKEFNIEYGIASHQVLECTSEGSFTKPRFNFSINNGYKSTIVEDRKSGFEFYKLFINDISTSDGAGGVLKQITEDKVKCKRFIVDGAAFGKYIDNCYQEYLKGTVDLITPESFEWLLLHAPIFDRCNDIKDKIENPDNHGANYTKYSTWENYYVDVLNLFMSDCELGEYNKKTLPDFAIREYKEILQRAGYSYLIDDNILVSTVQDSENEALSMLDSIFG